MASSDLSDLKPLYLIYGSEDLLLQRAVKRLRDRLAAVADVDFNLETFSGESATADDIVNAANTLPFLSERRLVIVSDVDRLDAAAIESLTTYAKDPAPSTCLVLVARKIAKNSKLYRAVAAGGVVYEYAAPKRSEYSGEVVRLLRDRGKRIEPRAAQALVDLVGRDLLRLDTEADKLTAYAGESGEVTLADGRAVGAAGPSATIFELADAVGSRDTAAALGLLRGILADGEPGAVTIAKSMVPSSTLCSSCTSPPSNSCTRTRGKLRRNDANIPGRRYVLTESLAPRRTSPASTPRCSRRTRTASSARKRTACARGRNNSPSGVHVTLRLPRSKSRVPNSVSKRRI